MLSGLDPLSFLVLSFAGWINQRQQHVIEYLIEENRVLGLTMNSIQLRDEHWEIADLVGKGGHIRTVPIPLWVKRTLDSWTELAHITTGRVFRAINKAGRIRGDGMTPKVLWEVVKDAAA